MRQAALRLLLWFLLPLATAWVRRQERRILAEGVPLGPAQLGDARALGVAMPERIRLLCLPQIPLPSGALVRKIGQRTGLLSTEAVGMSMRHGIFLRTPHDTDRRLLAHEMTHTLQYERLGGIRPFLRQYLWECLTVGYHAAPLEREARTAADTLCG